VVPLAVARQEPTVTLLADGRILAIGGSVSTVNCAVVPGGEVYDPATDAWTTVTGLATARDAAIGTLLADGRVLISLGAASASAAVNRNTCELHRFLNDSEVLDPAKLAAVTLPAVVPPTVAAAGLGVFASTAGPAVSGAVALALPDGGALVMGGSSPLPAAQGGYLVPSAAVWRFGPDGALSKAAPMVSARSAPAAVRLTDGTVLVVGPDGSGFKQGKPAGPTAERFDPVTGAWHPVADPGPHVGAALAALPGGGAILIGGTAGAWDKPFAIDATTLLFDAATEKWSPGPPMPAGVLDPAVASLPDGRVLVAGGIGMNGPVTSVFLYDPVATTWSVAADLPAARARAASVVLVNGTLVLVGGYGSLSQLADAVVFSPTTGVWTTTATFGPARESFALAALGDGRVLVAGGLAADGTGAALATTLLLDPATGTWTLGPSLSGPRTAAAVVQTGAGMQLVGGADASPSTTRKALATRDVLGAP
jgi:hypothetical protein